MRLLADENFPMPAVEALQQAGHDVTWVRTDLPGVGDGRSSTSVVHAGVRHRNVSKATALRAK